MTELLVVLVPFLCISQSTSRPLSALLASESWLPLTGAGMVEVIMCGDSRDALLLSSKM